MGYDLRERLMSLDFVSIVALEFRAGLMGHGGVFLSGDGLIPSDWGHSVGGRNISVFTYLKCPTKEGFQSRALSRGD